MPTSAKSADKEQACRCRGTAEYTVEISLADAVVSIRRLCLDHLPHRARVKDSTTGRIGEVMDVTTASDGHRVYVRPLQGGREWTASVDELELLAPV